MAQHSRFSPDFGNAVAALRRCAPPAYDTAMTEQTPPVDLTELAKKLLDLWQDQVAAVAADPNLADQMARLSAAMMQQGASQQRHPAGSPAAASGGATAGGSEAAEAAGMSANPAANQAAALADWWKTGMTAWSNAMSQQLTAFKSMQGEQRAQPNASPNHASQDSTGRTDAAPNETGRNGTGRTPSGAAATAPASGPRADDLEQLRSHLAKLDARLAALEGGTEARPAEGKNRSKGRQPAARKSVSAVAPEAGGSAPNAGSPARRGRSGGPRQGTE